MNVSHFFNNVEGLNLTDSPLYVKDGQATGGYNYDYVRTGGISKIQGLSAINSVANSELRSLGFGLYNTASGTKTVMRAAGTKLQTVDIDAGTFANTTEDTAAVNSDFLTTGSTQQVENSVFNNAFANTIWFTGGGMDLPRGYTGTKITKNGVDAPTGTFTAVNQGSGAGSGWTVGNYYYALVLRKTSTQALSNAALDQLVVIATATDSVLLTFPTGVDTTKYDKWYVYRSSVNGALSFTAGSLVAQVTVGTATFTDTNITFASSQVVPRAGSISLDNSPLPAGTYNYITTYKRRLIVASDSTVYISDLDKPESWPIGLRVTIPTGGPITALSIIGYNEPFSGSTDEYLVIFKERELWVITGTGALDSTTFLYDVELKFVDNTGCARQALVVRASGYIAWIDYRGVYLWNGSGKSIYVSRPIEAWFGPDGDLNKTKLNLGWGKFFRKKNQIIWTLSHRTLGENMVQLKLDLRLTAPRASQDLGDNTVIEGVFNTDTPSEPLYAGMAFLPENNEELFVVGDKSGFIYTAYTGVSDNGSGIEFSYQTKAFDMGLPTIAKQFGKVVLYIDRLSNKDLTLNYWAGYRTLAGQASERVVSMDDKNKLNSSLWDLAVWDISLWDEYSPNIIPLVFNLDSDENNNQGDAIMLKFQQLDALAPVVIHGFSIYWDEISARK